MLSDVFLTSVSAGHDDNADADVLLASYANTEGFQSQMDYHPLEAQSLTFRV